ncbi:NAD(P)-dependent oxidoreductase, partial [Phaeovulum sp.]|uniref:NAD(P)-dependent oxidoreductase n=1 Tax=Phaeovulum sp. TaxID=2934796 RepID=UPI00356706E1
MLTVLFAAPATLWPKYESHLAAAFSQAGLAVRMATPDTAPETVDYIIYAPSGPLTDFSPYCNVRAVLSLWAGVERIVSNPTLTQPLARMVDPALTEGMVEWVTGHVLRYHLGMDAHILGQDGIWRGAVTPPLARERGVTILGLGELGSACASALATLNFRVTGWSRSPRALSGVNCVAGQEALASALAGGEILVTLLPNTPDTENLLNAATLAQLPRGARLINPGRGNVIDDAALLAALDSGQIGHATLDVFRTEPLPAE